MITKAKGTIDLFGKEAKKWQYVNKLIDDLMEKYNYELIRTPIFESSELFHRGVGETTDIVTKETYDFVDRGKRKMTLRPEGTAGVVRSFIENKVYGNMTGPVKYYYNGTMYRYERPQAGRDREFTQFGVEVFGIDDPSIDAEVISIAVNLLKILSLENIKVRVNSLGDVESRKAYEKVLKAHLDSELKNLCADCKSRYDKNPLRILDCKVDAEKEVIKTAPKLIDYLNEESTHRLKQLEAYLKILEIDYEIDSSIVRGLDYYDQIVFEIEARVEGFGSNNVLVGGGRYNRLVSELGGPETPAVGFAMGMGRLIRALDLEEIELPIDDENEIFVMSISETEREYAISLMQVLRMNGFRVSGTYDNKSLKAQFKQADRENSKFLIILNDKDLAKDEVKVKNNKTKEEELVMSDYLIYYFDEKLSDIEDIH